VYDEEVVSVESHHDKGERPLAVVWWADRDDRHCQHQRIERLEKAAKDETLVAGRLGLLDSVGPLPAEACRRLSGRETYRNKKSRLSTCRSCETEAVLAPISPLL